MKLRCLFLLLIFSLLSSRLKAQQPYFRELETSPAINDIQINKLIQSVDGYLWLGTNKGIQRFNGNDAVYPANFDAYRSNTISSLEKIGSQIVAGTNDGKIIFINAFSNSFVKSVAVADDKITCLKKDHYGNIWIGTNSTGIYIFDQKEKLTHLQNIPDNAIHEIICEQTKVIAATDAGLIIWEDASRTGIYEVINTDNGLPDNLITSMHLFSKNKIIIGNQNGTISQLDLDSNSITPYPQFNQEPKGSISKILFDEGRFICFTDDRKIYIIKNPTDNFLQSFSEEFTPFTPSHPFGDGIIDMEGNILICNHTHQIHIADSRFLFVNEHENISLKNIRSLYCDTKNNLWFQTSNGLFYHEHTFSNQSQITNILPAPSEGKNEIISIGEDHLGNMWLGLYGGGIIHYNTTSKVIKKYTENDGLTNNNVLSIATDQQGVWLATLDGACYIDLSGEIPKFQEIEKVSQISKYIYSVFVDSKNNVWFGTDGNGPVVYANGTASKLIDQFPYVSKNILDITEDQQGNIWLLTQEQEIQCVKNNNVEVRKIVNEGVKPRLLAFEKDHSGNILALTNEGFALLRSDNPRVEFLPFRDKINSNYLNIASTDNDGNIWMALEPALIRFTPSNQKALKKPLPRIEKIMVLLEAIDSTKHIFSHHENHFSFKFSATWFQHIEKVKYRYKLDGFDSNWMETRDGEIAFPKLPSGKYTFKLQASTGNGWQDANEVSYQFEINKPIYFQWWFILFSAGCLVFFVFFLVQRRENNLREKASLEKERIQSQFDTLRNQINPHFLFNSFNTLISTISKDRDLAISYVENLSDYFRTILEQRDKEVIQLEEEVQLVEQYLFLQKQRFGENLIYEINIDKKYMRSQIPPLTLQLLVENAIKHNVISRSKPLIIEIKANDSTISVCNNLQEKTTKEPSTGVGLNNIINRYQILFQKSIHIEKSESNYCVSVPIINNV